MARTVFVSYHHAKDQRYADTFRSFYGIDNTIIDRSLPQEIDSDDDDYILGQIRTKHLRNSTVTVILIGSETANRKWVDWEIYSSLRPYGSRTVNGLLGILLPNVSVKNAPPRFLDNYQEQQVPGFFFSSIRQTGFSRLIKWQDISPPSSWGTFMEPIFKSEIEEKRNTLHQWIEVAFSNRANIELINNTRPRYKNNRPVQRRTPGILW